MPEAEIARRGGAVRVRTQKLPGGRYRHIFVVREAGPEGGHTVAGEVHKTKSKPFAQPRVTMRPKIKLPKRGKRGAREPRA